MQELMQLRLAAREIFEETLRAVDTGDAVRHAIHVEGSHLSIGDITREISSRKVYSIAIGKAAARMAAAIDDVMGQTFTSGIITSSSAALS